MRPLLITKLFESIESLLLKPIPKPAAAKLSRSTIPDGAVNADLIGFRALMLASSRAEHAIFQQSKRKN
jgi:hypothetical protein